LVTLYVDGVNKGSVSLAGSYADPGKNPWIGLINYPACDFDGIIDEVRIWNGALTLAQIQQSYALGIETEATVVLGEQFLADGGVAIFTSAFYWPSGGAWTFPVTLSARVMIVSSTATVTGWAFRKVTPRGSVDYYCALATDGHGVDVALEDDAVDASTDVFEGGAKSLHLTMLLSETEGLGFNIQNLPYG